MRHAVQFAFAAAVSFVSFSAQANSPHETLYFQGTPTPEQVSQWSELPGSRSYVIDSGDPIAEQLKPLAQLRGADRIQVEVQSYPNEDSLDTWKSLAAQGIDLVVLNKPGLPTVDEVRRLNDAAFGRCIFVLDYLPGPEEAQRLGDLHCKVSLTFAVTAYPKFEDKPGLIAIPESIPLLFATDYWPWYNHMDLLNLLPHHKQLRVLGMMPPEDSVQYLQGIKRLDSVQVNVEFDPDAQEWRKFDGIPLTWSSQNHVPSAEALAAFARSGRGRSSRKLLIDSDTPWTAEERSRIERSPLTVEWLHRADL